MQALLNLCLASVQLCSLGKVVKLEQQTSVDVPVCPHGKQNVQQTSCNLPVTPHRKQTAGHNEIQEDTKLGRVTHMLVVFS